MKKIDFFKTILLSLIISVLSFSFVSAKTVIRTDEAAIGEADPAKFSDNIDSVIIFNVYDASLMKGKMEVDLNHYFQLVGNIQIQIH